MYGIYDVYDVYDVYECRIEQYKLDVRGRGAQLSGIRK
jgi:hypothetical protein